MVVREETVITKFVQPGPLKSLSDERLTVVGTTPGSEPEIDCDRVVWDIDYRRHVVNELNRLHEPAKDRRDRHAAV